MVDLSQIASLMMSGGGVGVGGFAIGAVATYLGVRRKARSDDRRADVDREGNILHAMTAFQKQLAEALGRCEEDRNEAKREHEECLDLASRQSYRLAQIEVSLGLDRNYQDER